MQTNKANIAAAKLKVVEDAAASTPERAVGEVWEEAKVAKPPLPLQHRSP
jgi:nucleoprotein TPR